MKRDRTWAAAEVIKVRGQYRSNLRKWTHSWKKNATN